MSYLHSPTLTNNISPDNPNWRQLQTLMNSSEKNDIMGRRFIGGATADDRGCLGILSLFDIAECRLPETL